MKNEKLVVAFVAVPWRVISALAAAAVQLLSRSGAASQSQSQKLRSTVRHKWPPIGAFACEAVGDSRYQRELRIIVGGHGGGCIETPCIAELVCEDRNRHDSSTVAVYVQGHKVAYLCREEAWTHRLRLAAEGLIAQPTTCDALIVGGAISVEGTRQSYGVLLDLAPTRW